jgi:3-hydroxyisobutyrate dehydrogenase-like beta-hydroxyacid dehydrogenase
VAVRIGERYGLGEEQLVEIVKEGFEKSWASH